MNIELTVQPRKFPLILILIGTTLLAIPAALGTFALFDTSSSNGINHSDAPFLLWISLAGFFLYASYILMAIFRRHFAVVWFFSTLYNLGLSCVYLYGAAWIYVESKMSIFAFLYAALSSGIGLLPLWTIFVTIASGYYLKHSLLPNKTILP